ncbi:N-6 DNA methylase [Nocardiopsis ganjiahuensis]|uniref:N-6 DNA methylase n=1 Tax=Nocardiopsis ganjiahuensis TaxID=239984 RepID=UPI000593880B|nr:N-6 DNA methylase [Nocardiopsis ganjiahuensis]
MDSRDHGTTDEQQITAADIARLAGVTRAAVSNWRRRHDDFPSPTGGTSSSPLFPLAGVRTWLDSQNKGTEESTEVRMWHTLRGDYPSRMLGGLADVAEFLDGQGPGALSEAAVGLIRTLAEEGSPAEVVRGLTERFLNSNERAGAASASTTRLIRAVARLTGPDASSVFDPACGTGALLFALGGPGARRTGQDLDPDAVRFASARAALEGSGEVEIREGDALRSDRWTGHQAELVVCDPPPSHTDWGREELLMDPRWELALPPKAESELAWLQHAYAHTAPGGRTAMVMSTSCAYRRTGRRIRAELVRRGLLTGVIALPAGLAAGHSQPVHLWLLRRPLHEHDTASSVRMRDLTGADPDGTWDLSESTEAEVPLIDLLDDEVDLTPAKHLAPDLTDLPRAFEDAREQLRRAATGLGGTLPPLEGGTAPVAGTQIKVSDLIDAGMVELDGNRLRATDDRVDSDFLNGFLHSPVNTRRSTSASGTFRTDVRAARIPQMGVEEQRRYGAAFRAVAELERRAKELSALADQAARLAREGLTSGALAPEESP